MKISLLTCFAAGILISSSSAADLPDIEPPQITENATTNGVVTPLALTEPQKAMIRAEEVYRAQVQQELAAKADETKSPASRLWDALNSSFVLWLLSSVVLSGLAACYATWQHRNEKIKANRELIGKLDTEISNRIYEALSGTRSYEGAIKNNVLWQPRGYYTLMYQFLNNHFNSAQGETHSDFSIFQEYKECSFRALVTMLYDSMQTDREKKETAEKFKDVLTTYESFANLGSIPDKTTDLLPENILRVLLEIRETINRRILIERWRKDDLN
jgi:hypothetical protein